MSTSPSLTSFQAIEASLSVDAYHFVSSAKCFVNDFYFQCMPIRTTKQVAGHMRKAAKEESREQRMEMEFQPNDQPLKIWSPTKLRRSPSSKLRKANNRPATLQVPRAVVKIPGPPPEPKIKLKLVRTPLLQFHKGDQAIQKSEKHIMKSAVVLHSLVIVLLIPFLPSVTSWQKRLRPCQRLHKLDQHDQYNK